LISQVFTSFVLSISLVFIGKKKLNTFNNLNLLPLILLIYLFVSKTVFKDIVLNIFKFLNLGFSFDIFLVFSVISLIYLVIIFEINFLIKAPKKLNTLYYSFLFFVIFFFYLEKFYDHNYSAEKTSFLSVNIYFLTFFLLSALFSKNYKFSKNLDLVSKLVFLFIFINLATQTGFLNDLGDFDNGRYMNEVSAIFLGSKLHVEFFNFSGVFAPYVFRFFDPSAINFLINFRIFLRISLIVFSLLIGLLLLNKSSSKKIDYFYPFLISIFFLNSYLTLRSFSKIFTFLLILIMYLLFCNKFSHLTLYFLSLFSIIYFIELPTLAVFIIISILICLYSDFYLKTSLIYLIFSCINIAFYLQISSVSFSDILLVPLSLGNNAIPLTFRDMPFFGPFDSHILIFCLLIPHIFEKKDKKLKFVLLAGLSFTVYYSNNSDSGHLLFTSMLLLTLLISCFYNSKIRHKPGILFSLALGLLTIGSSLQILPNPNFNFFSKSEYVAEADYNQGNIKLSEFSNLNNFINTLNIDKENFGVLAPNSHIAEYLFGLKTPDILSWPEELAFDEKIYIQFCDNFMREKYKNLAAKEYYFHYYVPGFEGRDVLATNYQFFNICGNEYQLFDNLEIENDKWIFLEAGLK